MQPLKNFISMNEYSELGHNIDESRGEVYSINRTCENLRKIENSSSDDIKRFIHKIRNLRVKSNLEETCFVDEFDKLVYSWKIYSPNTIRNDYSMLEGFINKLLYNSEFVKGFLFKDENKIKLWVVVKDSVSISADEIYCDFINQYDEDEYSIMIYDNEVLDYVEKQVEFITSDFEVISKDAC